MFFKIFFGMTCSFWLSLLFLLFFCHRVVHPSIFQVNTGIKLTPEDHGSDFESTTFTTRPVSFPGHVVPITAVKFQLVYYNFLSYLSGPDNHKWRATCGTRVFETSALVQTVVPTAPYPKTLFMIFTHQLFVESFSTCLFF